MMKVKFSEVASQEESASEMVCLGIQIVSSEQRWSCLIGPKRGKIHIHHADFYCAIILLHHHGKMSYTQLSPSPTPQPTLSPAEYHRLYSIETSLQILMKIGGAISCISSFLLAKHILKKKWADISLTSMVLLGISVVDMIASFFGPFMGLWMAGEGVLLIRSGPLLAGNTQTCTAQGFIIYFSRTYFVTAYAGLGALCE